MTSSDLQRKLNRAQKLVHSHSAEALNLALEVSNLARENNDPKAQSAALLVCAHASFNFGQNHDVLAYLAEVSCIATENHIGDSEGDRLELYARTQYTLGAYPVSRDSWNRCLTLPDDAINLETRVKAHIGLGQLYYAHEHYQTALAHHRKAEDLAAGSEDYHLQGGILINIAADLIACEQLSEAYTVLKDALPLVKADQSYRNEAEIYMQIGRIQLLRGEYDRAKMSLMVALKINRLHIHQWNEANTQMYLGRCYMAKGEMEHALDYFSAALKMAKALGALHLEANVHQACAEAYTKIQNADLAAFHAEQYQSLRSRLLSHTQESQLETRELPF